MKCNFGNLPYFFCQKTVTFAERSKTIKQLLFSSKKTSKRSAAPLGCSFKKFDKKSRRKSKKFAQRPKNLSKVSSLQRNLLELLLEHFDCSFDKLASVSWLIVQTLLLEVRKWFKKPIFHNFFLLIVFSVLMGCFFDTPTFLSNDKKIAQTLKQMNKYNFFFKRKRLFLKKCLWTRGLQLWQPVKNCSD